jgi:hypothetical protein
MKNNPACPYCGYEFDDEETWYSSYSKTGEVYTGDGDCSELTCPNDDCKKVFDCTCVHIVTFLCEKLEDE